MRVWYYLVMKEDNIFIFADLLGDAPEMLKIKVPRGGIRWPVHQVNDTSREEGKHVDYATQMLREKRALAQEAAEHERSAAVVAAVEMLHVDEMSVGTKVSFVKRFSGQREYTYLALKTHNILDGIGMDLWYVTNKSRTYTNGEFEELLAEKLGFEDFTVLVPARENPNVDVMKGWVGTPARAMTHAVGLEMDGEESSK